MYQVAPVQELRISGPSFGLAAKDMTGFVYADVKAHRRQGSQAWTKEGRKREGRQTNLFEVYSLDETPSDT